MSQYYLSQTLLVRDTESNPKATYLHLENLSQSLSILKYSEDHQLSRVRAVPLHNVKIKKHAKKDK